MQPKTLLHRGRYGREGRYIKRRPPADLTTTTDWSAPDFPNTGKPRRIAIVGHGKSVEWRGWGPTIDAHDVVVRMWDCQWQDPQDYGTHYDYGLYEAHPYLMRAQSENRTLAPTIGFIASLLAPTSRAALFPNTEIVDQRPWTTEAMALGGIGATGKLQFQRGTIAALWAITRAKPGDEVTLFGSDNTLAGYALPISEGYSDTYRNAPASYTFNGYIEGAQRYGNHDFAIERPFMEMVAARHGVRLTFAQEKFRRRTALVLGDAACVHEDARRALEIFTPDAICATNNIGRDWEGHVDYWVTLHPERCPYWKGMEAERAARIAQGRNCPETWAHRRSNGIDKSTPDWQGSTGLLCVKALRELGFDRIVLAGVPMSADGAHYYNAEPWRQFTHYTVGWNKRRDEIAPYVRSMSGWTKELFGEPSPDWLAHSEHTAADAAPTHQRPDGQRIA